MKKKPILVICGPTASGKTNLSIQLAKALNGEIVSADSMQIYRGMDIGTAKPTTEEKSGIPHHMLDILDVNEEFSVADYVSLARESIDSIHKRNKLPILIGGTGLYIQAIVDNIQFAEMPSSDALREKYSLFAEKNGNEALWNRLNKVDPTLADKLHPNNKGRIIRGLEVFELTDKPLSLWQEESRSQPSPYGEIMIGLNYENRSDLYERINQRVHSMLQEGLLEEARWFFSQPASLTAKQAIGYKELELFLRGEQSLDTAIDQLQKESRRYAKRQLTWMRKEQRIHWFYINQFETCNGLYQAAETYVRQQLIEIDY